METLDEEVVARVLAGEQEAFEILVKRYGAALSAFAYDRVGSMAEAQDLVQETLVTAYSRLSELRDESRFAAWVYGILRTNCAMRLRRRGIEERSVERLAHQRAGNAPLTPLELAESQEREARLRLAVAGLSPVLREAVVLRYIGGAGRQEAANLLEISVEALDKRMERALGELRRMLGE